MRIIMTLMALVLTVGVSAKTIDKQKSVVNFSVSNMKFKTVEGTFSGMKGEINFDAGDLATSNFNVCIDAATVDTENTKRDDHLRNEDFFEVETYPTICFESESITKDNDGYKAKGTLSMHGVNKTIEVPFTYSDNKFEGTFTVNRFDYKVGEDMKTFMVGSDVTITVISYINE